MAVRLCKDQGIESRLSHMGILERHTSRRSRDYGSSGSIHVRFL